MIPTREEQDALAASLGFKAVEMWVWAKNGEKRKRKVVGQTKGVWFDDEGFAWDYASPIAPKRRVPMDFRDKCRIVADGGELGVSSNIGNYPHISETEVVKLATHYRTSPDAEWMPCTKEVEE